MHGGWLPIGSINEHISGIAFLLDAISFVWKQHSKNFILPSLKYIQGISRNISLKHSEKSTIFKEIKSNQTVERGVRVYSLTTPSLKRLKCYQL